MATTSQAVEPPVAVPVEQGPVVRAEHLSKRFGDLVAVDDLSFALERGTVTGFLGPNGAGKTTTLRMLLHLVQPTAGRRARVRRPLPGSRAAGEPRRSGARGGRLPSRPLRARPPLLARARARREPATTTGSSAVSARRGKRVDAVLDLVELTAAGPPPRRQLLARHATAARARRRAARRPGAADPRRARERARPGGRALAARLHARLRGRGKDGPRLQPRARRGRSRRSTRS